MDTSFKNIFSFDRTPPDDCFLCLSMNFERFFRTLLLYSITGKLLLHVQAAEFHQMQQKTTSQVLFKHFFTRSRSSHSKVFMYLRSLKTKKKLICNEVARCHPVILRKKHFHTSSYFLPSFSQNASRLLLSKRLWKCMSTILFRKYKRKVVLSSGETRKTFHKNFFLFINVSLYVFLKKTFHNACIK